MNSWKMSLFGVGAGVGLRRGGAKSEAGSKTGRLMISLLQGGIVVETKWRAITKREELPCLLNRLAKLLDESF